LMKNKTSLLTLCLIALLALPTESAEHKKLNDPDLVKREYMVKISRQLGVTCNHCHDVNNFKSELMPTYKVAKEHMHIVDLLNKQGFKAKNDPKADCFMCHRGTSMPDYKEKTLDKK